MEVEVVVEAKEVVGRVVEQGWEEEGEELEERRLGKRTQKLSLFLFLLEWERKVLLV